MNKLTRILMANNLDVLNTKILDVVTTEGISIIYAELDGIKYKIEGFTKTIISNNIGENDINLNDYIEIDESDDDLPLTNINIENIIEETDEVEVSEEVEAGNEISKPRGWHFKKVYVDVEGNVYFRGIEQPELRGTLIPTI